MSISFSGSELLKIAIDIERRGIAFYDVMAKSVRNTEARNTFQYLTDMERVHVQIFQVMLGEADKYQPAESYSGEYTAYLQALVDSAVFTDNTITSELATKTESDIEALELAIGVEKDSILFYYEMKDIMSQQTQPTVSKVITEEKLHLSQLSALKRKLVATQ